MASNIRRKIELVANIAIIAVAAILGGILVSQYYFADERDAGSANADPRIPAGTSANDTKTSIEPVELKRALDGGNRPVVLDVSEREDYAQGHIPGARNIPFDELDIRAANELSGSDSIVIYCRCADDELSRMASKSLHRQSFRQAVVLNGGLDAWRRSGLPVASQ